MLDSFSLISTLFALTFLAIIGWSMSLKNDNVTIVDSLWGLFFLLASLTNLVLASDPSDRAYLTLSLVAIWSIRLSSHLHIRNHGQAEDHRYQAIRKRNEPNFRIKSLYLVFMLQAVLAWFISLPLQVAIHSKTSVNAIDYLGLALWLIGITIQTTADRQLKSFKQKPENKSRVLSTGIWRYSRHPNYFGEACIWFAYGLIALGAGTWWTFISPIFMTYLLIKVTGAKLLESDITHRRPDYQQYIACTSQFFPWWPKDPNSKA